GCSGSATATTTSSLKPLGSPSRTPTSIAEYAANRAILPPPRRRARATSRLAATVGRVWTAPWMQGLRQKNSVRAVAVVCPACLLRHMAAGPDGFRDPLPNGRATLLATTLHGL